MLRHEMCLKQRASLGSSGEGPLKLENRGVFTRKAPWCISVSIPQNRMKRFLALNMKVQFVSVEECPREVL
jgi:hypothetical protein